MLPAKPGPRAGRYLVRHGNVILGERTYASKKRRPSNILSFEGGKPTRRMNEVFDLVKYRPPHHLPDTDDVSEYLFVTATCLYWKRVNNLAAALAAWCARIGGGPADLAEEVARIASRVTANPLKLSASTCGRILRITDDERDRLRITTMRSLSLAVLTKSEMDLRRAARKRQIERDRREARRIARGGTTRAEWRATRLTAAAPWKALGISRRTWERRRSAERVAGCVAAS